MLAECGEAGFLPERLARNKTIIARPYVVQHSTKHHTTTATTAGEGIVTISSR